MQLNSIILLSSLLMTQALGDTNAADKNTGLSDSGYKPYIAKEPFHILVNNDFPSDKSMLLCFPSLGLGPISFRMDDNTKNQGKRAVVSLPSGVDIGILLDKNGKAQGIIELLSAPGQRMQMLKDFNMDGIWDTKVLLHPTQSFIFMQSEWLQVTSITDNGTKIEAVIDNKKFLFHGDTGQWKEEE